VLVGDGERSTVDAGDTEPVPMMQRRIVATLHERFGLRPGLSVADAGDIAALRRYMKSTTPDEELGNVTGAFEARLAAVTPTSTDWTDAFDRFECADAVVLLTAWAHQQPHPVQYLAVKAM
jgi:hypothetical protein